MNRRAWRQIPFSDDDVHSSVDEDPQRGGVGREHSSSGGGGATPKRFSISPVLVCGGEEENVVFNEKVQFSEIFVFSNR